MKIERAKLGNYLGHICLEQMLSGLQETFGPETTAFLVSRAGEQMGRDIAHDWNIRADLLTPERLPLLLEAALGDQGHNLAGVQAVALTAAGITVSGHWPAAPLIRELTLGCLRGLLGSLLGAELSKPMLDENGQVHFALTPHSLLQAS